jgi:periplasmic divalent cation tolerance protein
MGFAASGTIALPCGMLLVILELISLKQEELNMIQLLYITVKNREEARSIAAGLLARRLIACANIIGDIESLYHWQGELCDSQEVLLLAKTTEDKIPAVLDAVKTMHSYELPCIVAFPATNGLPAFLQWVAGEVED